MEKDFKGYVDVFNEKIYVDTKKGVGVARVLKKMEPIIYKMAMKTYMPGSFFEDVKQELTLLAIEGLRYYDPNRNVKLSTFLHLHLRNKLISRLKNKNKLCHDAFYLDEKKRSSEYKIPNIREEIKFSHFDTPRKRGSIENNGIQDTRYENTISTEDGFFRTKLPNYDEVEFDVTFNKLIERLDETTAEILKLIYYEDYTIQDAAKEVGLSDWAANQRIRRLAFRPLVRRYFEKSQLK